MPSNPLGPKTRNITLNVDSALFVGADQLAGICGITVAKYVRALLADAVKNKTLVRESPASRAAFYQAVQKGSSPMPERTLEVVPQSELQTIPPAVSTAGAKVEPKKKRTG